MYFCAMPEDVVQVLQNGHLVRGGVAEIFLINQTDRAVNDGLFDGFQTTLAAHNQLAEGEDEVRFQGDGALFCGVLSRDILRNWRKIVKSFPSAGADGKRL